ncbi:hypothetical protein ATI61_11327 [Archangium gephyra]|uniref:Outer membrane beta-barrel porin/alpha-amylase n=2 Tax=Archangium gephyra TaxID=48 RepID=A0ABX9JR04_9BACT|nr:hypothetical protein [Archangium gephyra]REG24964.1 hypothetical protein ATI61_11327 [Archangium gephyra]
MPSSASARTLLCGLLLLGSNSLAEGPTGDTPEVPRAAPPLSGMPARRLNLDHFVGGGVNPTVAEYKVRISDTRRLGQSEELLWRDTFLGLGGQVRLNPCYAAVGPMVNWQPIAVFNLKALVDAYGFFGTAGMLQSFRSPLDEYSDAVQRANTASQQTYGTLGWHAMLQPTLQAQVGPIALQNVVTLDYFNMRLRGDDTLWYDAGPDTLLPGRGLMLTEEVNLVYFAGPLTLGATFRYLLPFYDEENFRPGEDVKAANNANMRLGALVAYTFKDGGYSSFNHPTAFLTATWHVRHRYRAGQETSQAIPFVGLGFAFQQDFVF